MSVGQACLLQASLLAGVGNLIGAVILLLQARNRPLAVPTAVLLLVLTPWVLALGLQSLPEIQSSIPGLIDCAAATFFLIPPAALHTACTWSGRGQCKLSRFTVALTYIAGAGATLATASGLLDLGPLVNREFGTTRRESGATFLIHAALLFVAVVIGFTWCINTIRRHDQSWYRMPAYTWLLGAAVFLPLAVTNYLVVYDVLAIPLGAVGNLLFLVVLIYASWRWDFLAVEQLSRRITFLISSGIFFALFTTDALLLAFNVAEPNLFWFANQLSFGAGVIFCLFAYSVGNREGVASFPFAPSNSKLVTTLRLGKSEDEQSALLIHILRSRFSCKGVAVYRKEPNLNEYKKVSAAGFPFELPEHTSNQDSLAANLRSKLNATASVLPSFSNKGSNKRQSPKISCWTVRPTDTCELIVAILSNKPLLWLSGPTGEVLTVLSALAWQPRTNLLQDHGMIPETENQQGKAAPTSPLPNRSTDKIQDRPLPLEEITAIRECFPEIIGTNEKLLRALRKVQKFARLDIPIAIYGETGVGKELIAQAIHRLSGRTGLFFAWNAATVAPELAESTLFGHVKGAFTGAHEYRPGYLREADHGTLFIDEIDSLDLTLQGKLLRALETKEFYPLGSDKPVKVDVRLVVASHYPLHKLVRQKRLRADLCHRLSAAWVHVPPLRERKEDIPSLVDHLLQRIRCQLNLAHLSEVTLTDNALSKLLSYSWPGNVRELFNVLTRAVCQLQDSTVVDAADIEFEPATGAGEEPEPLTRALRELARVIVEKRMTLRETSNAVKRALAEYALERSDGKRAAAARLLRMSRTNFNRLLRHVGMHKR